MYIPFGAIEAVTVDGVRPTAKEEPPTRRAARRLAEDHARRLSKALGIDITVKAPFEETEAGEPMRVLVERSETATKASRCSDWQLAGFGEPRFQELLHERRR